MDHLLLVLLLLLCWGPGVHGHQESSGSIRLVGGATRCAGTLELNHQGEWRQMDIFLWTLKDATSFCQSLDCGSPVHAEQVKESIEKPVWFINSTCVQSGLFTSNCVSSKNVSSFLKLNCSDSVRLLNGTSLCSGRLEINSELFNLTKQLKQLWSSVCEVDFDLKDAEVVCRELGCGSPVVLQGTLHGGLQSPRWCTEFQCGGNESALVDCRSSGSTRSSCSPVGLTCSEPHRLVGGASRCEGTLQVKNQEEWRPGVAFDWTLKKAAAICEHLDCGSVISIGMTFKSSSMPAWMVKPRCFQSELSPRDCVASIDAAGATTLTCSDSVRLLNGSSLCSGRLEINSELFNQTKQSEQRWSSVCEDNFDLQDAEVVCRELGCGSPVVLEGALHGAWQAPSWSPEFQCGGNESTLVDCRSSGSARSSCSPVGLTCSEPFRLVGGASRCEGTLEMKYQGQWRPAYIVLWKQSEAKEVCKRLHCGDFVSLGRIFEDTPIFMWGVSSERLEAGDDLREFVTSKQSYGKLTLICSEHQQIAAAV